MNCRTPKYTYYNSAVKMKITGMWLIVVNLNDRIL